MKLSADELQAVSLAAREDLLAFTALMFWRRRGFTWNEAAHHWVICDALMRVFRGEITRLIINIPPRYSKTELAVVNFIAWCLGKVPDAEFIHVSYGAAVAVQNAANVRALMENEGYREVFPEVRLANDSRAHLKTTKDGALYATGASGPLTGMGAGKDREGFGGAIVIDDPHKADEALSDLMRKGVIDWYQNTLESRQNAPGRTPIIVIMQRLHQQDLAGWLIDGGTGEQWTLVSLPAIQPDGTALWPHKHSIEMLRVMEQAKPYTFAGQYQQRPSPAEGGIFKPGMLEVVDALPAGHIQWVRGWDFADSTKGDFTAGGKLGRIHDGRFVIGGMERERFTTDKRDALVKNTASRDGQAVRISIPQDPGQAGKGQVLAMTRLLSGKSVHSSPESGDKVTRAETFASQVNVGNVLMVRGAWNDPLVEEMRLFPNGTFDDQVDALSRAFEALMGRSGSTQVLEVPL